MDYELELPEGFEELTVLERLISPADPSMGVMIMGEDYTKEAEQVTIWVYLIGMDTGIWHIVDELEAFTFLNLESAKKFVEELPGMSAIDLLLLMNGHQSTRANKTIMQ